MPEYQFIIKKRKNKVTKQQLPEAYIYLRYMHKDTDTLIATGLKVKPDHWDPKNESVNRKYPASKNALDTALNKIKGHVMTAVSQLSSEGEDLFADDVKQRYTENTTGILRGAVKASVLWDQFLKDSESRKDKSTVDSERDSLNTFLDFCKKRKKEPTPRQITKELITAYEGYLATFADNTRAKKLKHFKAFLKHVKHPFVDLVKFKEVPGDRIFLTEAELTKVEVHPLPQDMEPWRNLVLLQCSTGLRVSDLFRLGPAHVQGKDLILRAQKTDTVIRMPLTERIKAILLHSDIKLPKTDRGTYNTKLRDILEAAIPDSVVEVTERKAGKKVTKTVKKHEVFTTHDCVRTFISLAAGRGMPVTSISRLTGKSVATLLRNYLGTDEDQAYQDALKFDRPLMTVNREQGAA